MRIIWWNMGYPFFWKWWRQLWLGRWDCFFLPKDGNRIRSWVQENLSDIFFGCEVVSEKDAQSLLLPRNTYIDWTQSAGHSHGRVVLSNVSPHKRIIADPEFDTEWYDTGDYYIAPVHLHWARPEIRLVQARALVRAALTLDKPVLIIGDFNIWMLFGRYCVFQKDRQAYQLLTEHFAEVTRSISCTMIVSFVKLDYVFAATQLSDRVRATTVARPVRGTDHLPMVIEIDD